MEMEGPAASEHGGVWTPETILSNFQAFIEFPSIYLQFFRSDCIFTDFIEFIASHSHSAIKNKQIVKTNFQFHKCILRSFS